jgi:hypothetical protein
MDDINEITYSSGLHWRRDSFVGIAKESMEFYDGNFLRVGDYVAGAVFSLASNKKQWIVDSNV